MMTEQDLKRAKRYLDDAKKIADNYTNTECKFCNWHKSTIPRTCINPIVARPFAQNGEVLQPNVLCTDARKPDEGACGASGAYFLPMVPMEGAPRACRSSSLR